ncbi:MAG: 16S rRNA (guanine(966)-N(2))-methyltransferase RsmD [Bacteroidetes bacterium]|nr:16S rRNA (guanine(966)-N(2))-methyltransferase RsmD [Bacteroidota bacterium]MBU2584945.1 16S rRNA (guanine(966)-N(2))-methyltransferase RsmD [Bacteroidota bacterium]
MRIISGEFKSRRIKSAKIEGLRPATDRYRETLFNILNNHIDFDQIKVCDLYAGTGAVGFECLSRGAARCVFIEKQTSVINLLKENSTDLKVSDRVQIVNETAERFTSFTTEKYDLIFADPPYFNFDIYKTYDNILHRKLVAEDGILIIQRSKETLNEDEVQFSKKVFKLIGDDAVYLFKF